MNLSKLFLFCLISFSCSESEKSELSYDDFLDDNISSEKQYSDINFSNWKLTLPVDEDNNGSPDEYYPNQLINNAYRSLNPIKPYMYDDTSDGSLLFYTFPNTSTTNSSYSRTELRELINPENSRDNWTLKEGGKMTGRLKIVSISQEDINNYGFNSNNGPPLIKIYWKDGYIWCHKKSLKDTSISGEDLIQPYTSSNNFWTDDKKNLGFVGYDTFDFSITASAAKIEVQLNNNNPVVYNDISLNKWQYENYFKAGNYLGTTDSDGFSYVKYYNLNVTH